ncbi:unnamed protein product [Mytilus coruscus]|uniref:CCHC-type domain-containing protein n=1 Tax=Mytilus coruscus TaxID=42192 RepID=A0A6J8DIC6_MYTCO|nr:unnamed protein product [Mytilus coruscus]
MPTYGKLDSFDESEDWTQYVERMEHYFNANEIDDGDQKRDIFLSVCGKNIYKLIRDLLAPANPGTKSLAVLTKLVKDHRDPVPSEIIQRFKFNSRTRHNDESVRTFIAALRSLTEHCNYGDTLNAMLRDRNNSGNSKQGDCYRCGGNHLAADCRFKEAKCHSYKKKGHIAKKCRNKSVNGNLSENHREFKPRFKPRAHFMEQDESSESEKGKRNTESLNSEQIETDSAVILEANICMKAKIYVDESARKARPLPYALKDKVEMELERLEKEGQIQQVEFSDWAAPKVPVVKENGSIRICGDYKVTVNAVSKLDNCPIPKTEDLYATLGGGQ